MSSDLPLTQSLRYLQQHLQLWCTKARWTSYGKKRLFITSPLCAHTLCTAVAETHLQGLDSMPSLSRRHQAHDQAPHLQVKSLTPPRRHLPRRRTCVSAPIQIFMWHVKKKHITTGDCSEVPHLILLLLFLEETTRERSGVRWPAEMDAWELGPMEGGSEGTCGSPSREWHRDRSNRIH